MYKVVWKRREMLNFSGMQKDLVRVGDLDSLQGQVGAFWTGKQEELV